MSEAMNWLASPDNEVCVCGIGAHTPLGFCAAASAAAVRSGISAIAIHPFLVDKTGEPMSLASGAGLPADLTLLKRFDTLLSSALFQATSDEPVRRATVPGRCLIALPQVRPGVDGELGTCASAAASKALDLRPASVRLLQRGHASGLIAMQIAARELSDGDVDVCVVAGVDSYHDLETLEWLDSNGLLMSAANRNGFPPGEAAGACVLCTSRAADRYGLPILGRLVAASTTNEPHTIRGTEVCLGEGLSTALMNVIESDRPTQEKIGSTYCDLNGERYRSEELTYTLLRVQNAFINAHDYTSPADCWGDVGAASGTLFAVLAVMAKQRGYSKGRYSVLWAGSENGDRSAVLLDLGET